MHLASWRNRTLATGLAVAGLALVGCGGDNDQSSTDPAKTAGLPAVNKDPALHDLLPADIREAGVVTVSVDVPYPPFEYFADEGGEKITGFDYDFGQALADRLGVRFDFSQQKFDGIIPALQAGKYDVTISAMSDIPERRPVLDFVDYFNAGTGIMVPKGNPLGVDNVLDLCGHTAATQSGGQQVRFLKAQQPKCEKLGTPDIKIAALPKISDAQLAVTSGKADAVVEDQPSSAYQARTISGGKVFEVVEDPEATGGYNAEPGGVGILKGNDQLVHALQKATQSLMDDGTYQKVLDKYGLRSIGIPTATVNGAE